MSFRGEMEARCPEGCEPFTTEAWSFIRGDASPALREAVLARECNLLLCPACGRPFFAETPYVYLEPPAEILAFVFPLSYKKQAAHWCRKMHEDFVRMQEALGSKLPLDIEPNVFFGPEGLAELLAAEDYRNEEAEVMECVARSIGLELYRARPSAARKDKVPAVLPVSGGKVTQESVIEGLKKLLEANDALKAYRACLKKLEGGRSSLPSPALPAAG